jgi:D-alanine-D-alanine ligase
MIDAPGPLRIAVLYGGRSSEHEVSVMSATNVMRALDPAKYELVPVYVTRQGRWLLGHYADGAPDTPSAGREICLVPGGKGRMLAIPPDGRTEERMHVDALFPVLHGMDGEDGSIQGLAQAARVPLVGCGILGSAAALDKDMTKRLLLQAGVPVARSMTVVAAEVPAFAQVEAVLGLPVFVKPARQGSSVGVSKVAREAEWRAALDLGFRHDAKLLVEEFVKGREIELAVLEAPDGSLFVSRPGEIAPAPSHGFYSYDAKYVDADGARIMVPAELPAEVEERLKMLAGQAFRAVGCDAMARVDFFVTDNFDIRLNELNTIPGFTDISMYPKAMAQSGVSYAELLDRLIAHGLARAKREG